MGEKEFRIVKKVRYINENGEYLTQEEQVVSRYNEYGYLFKNRSDCLKLFFNEQLPNELKDQEIGKLYLLATELNDGQKICYRSSHRFKPHTVKTLAKRLELSERRVRELLKNLKRAGVIGGAIIDGKKYLMINPKYIMHGTRISMETYYVFQEQLQPILPEWVVERFETDRSKEDENYLVVL